MDMASKGLTKEERAKLYLSDAEYIKLLEKVAEKVNEPGFEPKFFDSTETGDKYTTSNCGLCNDMDDDGPWSTPENVLFPGQFPRRRSFKYRLDHQLCPFDERTAEDMKTQKGWNGCFYTCYLFKDRLVLVNGRYEMASRISVDEMKAMAAKRLSEAMAAPPSPS